MMPLKKPTKVQAKVLAYLKVYQAENGAPPSIREICGHFNWVSKNSALDHLKQLRDKGYVRHFPGRSRGWVCL